MQKKIDKMTYLVEVHYSPISTQSLEDKLKRAILHSLEHGKQSWPGKVMKNDECTLASSSRTYKKYFLKPIDIDAISKYYVNT